jgi:hypothetical protein
MNFWKITRYDGPFDDWLECVNCHHKEYFLVGHKAPGDWAYRFYNVNGDYDETRHHWLHWNSNSIFCSLTCFEEYHGK